MTSCRKRRKWWNVGAIGDILAPATDAVGSISAAAEETTTVTENAGNEATQLAEVGR